MCRNECVYCNWYWSCVTSCQKSNHFSCASINYKWNIYNTNKSNKTQCVKIHHHSTYIRIHNKMFRWLCVISFWPVCQSSSSFNFQEPCLIQFNRLELFYWQRIPLPTLQIQQYIRNPFLDTYTLRCVVCIQHKYKLNTCLKMKSINTRNNYKLHELCLYMCVCYRIMYFVIRTTHTHTRTHLHSNAHKYTHFTDTQS